MSLPSLGDSLPRLPSIFGRSVRGGAPEAGIEEVWATLPRSRQLEILGAPEVEVDSARQFESLRGPTGIGTVVGARTSRGDTFFEKEEPDPRRGLLEILTDFATRPQSAVTGFITGLTGAERLRQTRDARGVSDGALFEQPERAEAGFDLAWERFKQGLSGQEKFQAADFGALAYDRETAGTGERVMKSAAGFILDVAIDPITYLSFGGSILGRRAASVAVNEVARKNSLKLVGSLDEAGKAEAIRNAVRRAGTDESVLSRQLEKSLGKEFFEAGFERGQVLKMDEILSVYSRNPAAFDSVVGDSIAYTAAAMYRSFGHGGARKYLKTFGDSGMELWKSLPADLRGGLRLRVPLSGFANRGAATGARIPTVVRLSPLPAGALGDITGLSGISNGTRNWFRSKRLLRSGAEELSGTTGASNMRTATTIYNRNVERGSRWFGKKDLKVDPKGRAVSWANTMELEEGLTAFRRGVFGSAQTLLAPLKAGQESYRAGRAINGDEFDGLFDRAIRANLSDESGSTATIEEVFNLAGRQATDVEVNAWDSALNFQDALKRVEFELEGLESQFAGFRVNFLENYWPRIVDDIESELIGKGYGSGGFANLKNRTHFVAEFNGDGTVKRWMTPGEIAQQIGRTKFVESADVAMSAYLVSMNRFLQEERLFQHLLDRGVLMRGGKETFIEQFDTTAAARAWIETARTVDERLARVNAVGRVTDTPVGTLTGRALEEAVERSRQLATALESGRVFGPRLLENYAEVGPGVFRSIDGVTITGTANGTFRVMRSTADGNEFLTPASRWSRTEPRETFFSFEDAQAFADRNMATIRKRKYVEEMQKLRDEFIKNTLEFTRIGDEAAARGFNPLHPGNVPYSQQSEFFEVMSEGINLFGKAAGMRDRRVIAAAYRDAGWGDGLGQAFAPVSGSNGPQMRRFWAERMERMNVFAAETVVEDVRRMYRAIENPEGFKKWVNEYYRPFYALQKSLMTSQRGPGYVLRNIQGGMWNAYLLGTGGKHFRLAGAVKTAEYQARARAKKQTSDPREIGEVTRREFISILEEKLGKRRANKMVEAWELFEFRGLRGRELSSQTPGTQAVASGSGDLTGDLARLIPDADETSAQWLQRKGTSHLWARTMGDAAQGSEDYLRFASFLRGLDMYGMEDGGRAASLIVKASQFDYADLSRFEAETVKMLVPFYTWTRNNVPLQFRAMIAEPGKMLKAIRINDALADAFGEPDDPEEPLPAYVRERFGWRVREDIMTGPSGDAISAGMVVGEPLVDVNRLFGTPTRPGAAGLGSVLNWREIANNINPAITSLAPAVTSMELSSGGRLPREEEAPPWARMFARTTPEGDKVVSARALRTARQLIVPLGMAERYAPQLLGNDRLQRRWYTSLGSAIFGLPVSTLDPYQTSAELRAQEARLRSQLTREMGEEYPARVAYVRTVLELGASPQEMHFVRETLLGGRDIGEVPIEELDIWRMRDTVNFLRRIDSLRDRGLPQETIEMMVSYFRPRTDLEMGVRAGGVQPLTAEQLSELGETPESVARMTDDERAELVVRYAERNPSWRPKR